MDKHAFLIIAHNKPNQLRILLRTLDYPQNDIYLHIDRKADIESFELSKICVKAQLFIIEDRLSVSWGTNSLVNVELMLLEKSTETYHSYYHLLSGVDLPLKNQSEIDKKFSDESATQGIQYIGFDYKNDFTKRVKYYHFFGKIKMIKFSKELRRIQKIYNLLNMQIDNISLSVQKIVGIDRLKNSDVKRVYKGSQWFSITHTFAEYIISKKAMIQKMARSSDCCDEIFLQTLIMNSRFRDESFLSYKENSNLRCIDWDRGGPYTFRITDFEQLISSGMYFARKFDIDFDKEIILKIVDYLSEGIK